MDKLVDLKFYKVAETDERSLYEKIEISFDLINKYLLLSNYLRSCTKVY